MGMIDGPRMLGLEEKLLHGSAVEERGTVWCSSCVVNNRVVWRLLVTIVAFSRAQFRARIEGLGTGLEELLQGIKGLGSIFRLFSVYNGDLRQSSISSNSLNRGRQKRLVHCANCYSCNAPL
ncbi:hypothetical protein J3459_006005 [Metarhizium acridum]|nr:hypothetical protein J3459_006005 [Metarhizium acridum]